jgi:hypothetical protein
MVFFCAFFRHKQVVKAVQELLVTQAEKCHQGRRVPAKVFSNRIRRLGVDLRH